MSGITNKTYNLVTGPTVEPVSLAELQANDYMRSLDLDSESVLFNEYLVAAREDAEKLMNRKIMTQTWKVSFDRPVSSFHFPFGNLQTVNEVRIIQADGTVDVQDTSKYQFSTGEDAVFWLRADNSSEWTETERPFSCFEIDFTVGWATPGNVPQSIKNGIMAMVAYKYYNREETRQEAARMFHGQKIFRV